MLVAARDLQADELLGLYWGNVMTVRCGWGASHGTPVGAQGVYSLGVSS